RENATGHPCRVATEVAMRSVPKRGSVGSTSTDRFSGFTATRRHRVSVLTSLPLNRSSTNRMAAPLVALLDQKLSPYSNHLPDDSLNNFSSSWDAFSTVRLASSTDFA